MIQVRVKVDPSRITTRLNRKLTLALREAANLVGSRLHRMAAEKLNTTKGLYQSGIRMKVASNPPRAVIEIRGRLPEALELGYKSFDMKPGLLSGRSAKRSKAGVTYARVPIGLDRIRTVTSKTARGRWRHPGFKGLHLMPKVAKATTPAIRKLIESAVREAVLG